MEVPSFFLKEMETVTEVHKYIVFFTKKIDLFSSCCSCSVKTQHTHIQTRYKTGRLVGGGGALNKKGMKGFAG
jgi:hypothetical protein